MSTENEIWREDSNEENQGATNRDGNRNFNREGYNRSSYNREGNYNREGEYQNRSYGDRPQRNTYNRYGNNDRSGYNSDNRYQRSGDNRSSYNNREGNDRRPRFNPNSVDQYPRYNRDDADRRPRFSRNEGGQRSYDNTQRRYDNTQRSYDNTQRSYNQDRPSWRNNDDRRPRYNSGNEGGDQQRYQRPTGGDGNSYYNRGGDDRQRRPRISSGDDRRQSFARPAYRNNNYDPNAKYTRKKQIEYKEQYVDPNEPIRLNKYLANAGICSRREADEYIIAGVVSVNDVVVTELGTKIKRTDTVKFHEDSVNAERKVYILLNKPKDCVTTSDDPENRKTVLDLVKGACNERIYPVGRLDRNTTGVLLLTNDGDMASKLTHPKFLKKKIYHVTTDKDMIKKDMDQMLGGIKLEEEEVRADDIGYTDSGKRNSIGIEIHTGQNRVVRRLFEALGYRVVKLDRVYFAGLTKKGLRRGDWRYLTENEVNYLRMGSFR